MIDTIKIYAEIDKDTYEKIKSVSIVKNSIDYNNKIILYEIVNDHLQGSFDSHLSVRVDSGVKYKFTNKGYCIEIEGSYHKIVQGYNSHNGYSDLEFIVQNLVQMVELSYSIELPQIKDWYLQRCDIAVCYNLENQENVKSYINSLSRCKYPRRNIKFFYDESLYLTGTTTTLKIYNKMLEFKKHDIKKFNNSKFNLFDYLKEIQGFVRFECEIKKKMLKKLYNKNHISVLDINYEQLKKVWSDEFMKLLQFVRNDLEIVRGREKVYNRLYDIYKPYRANQLFFFYCSIQLNRTSRHKKSYKF